MSFPTNFLKIWPILRDPILESQERPRKIDAKRWDTSSFLFQGIQF